MPGSYALSHLSDQALLRDLASLVHRERALTAALLAHLAEVDARRLYLPAAYPSMFLYCVHELRLSEEAAFRRIYAARTARRFPAIFEAVAEGRLHLSAVVLLAPHLTDATAGELLAAAACKSKSEIEQLLAERFPRPDVPLRLEAVSEEIGARAKAEAANTQSMILDQRSPASDQQLGELVGGGAALVDQHAPGRVDVASRAPRLAPLGAERFVLQLTIKRGTHDKLRYAQALLAHQIPSGDVADVLDRALDALIGQLERRKFAATSGPRRSRRPVPPGSRYIPAAVKRAVWERDEGQCSFLGKNGRRCPARGRLEFDHVNEFARGGRSTIGGIRLRCRAHNQYGAECTFGAGFMTRKRQEAMQERRKRQEQREISREMPRATSKTSHASCASPEKAPDWDVVPWLRQLGFRAAEARRAAALCAARPDAPIEERVRAALASFHASRAAPVPVHRHAP